MVTLVNWWFEHRSASRYPTSDGGGLSDDIRSKKGMHSVDLVYGHRAAVLLLHPRRLKMILSSACALSGRRTSSSRDAPRSSLWRSASKAGQRSQRWSYDSSSLSHRRHVVSSDRLIRFFQRRSAGWWPRRKRRRSVVSDLDSRVSSC